MHHWTVHGKVDFPKFQPDVRTGGGGTFHNFVILTSEMHSKIFPMPGGVHSTTLHLQLRNERFTLISFMGFPAILSTLQPFQMCILNGNYE